MKMSSSLLFCVPLLRFRSRELLVWGSFISEGTSLEAGIVSRYRRSMGDMERRGKTLWAWLADFLSRTLQGIVRYLSASPSLSFCQLPSNRMVSYGRRMETDDRKKECCSKSENG